MYKSNYKKSVIKLNDEQQDILAGKQGKMVAKCFQTMLDIGETMGATRMVPTTFGHITGTFALAPFTGYYELLDKLVEEGCRVKVPTTTNPHPGREFSFLNRSLYRPQIHHEECMSKLGVIQNYSCAAYFEENMPEFGSIGACGESSVVVYMNSVFGARTNIWGVLTDFYQSISGYTPEFGLLLDENRVGEVLFDISSLNNPDPDALGLFVGKRAVDRTPVITHHDFDKYQLKHLLSAANSTGAARLVHIEGVTPEAPDLKTVFDGHQPKEIIKVTQSDLDAMRSTKQVLDKTDVIVYGCPQMTLKEVLDLAPNFIGKFVKKRTLFSMMPRDFELLKHYPQYEQLQLAGIEIVPACPLTYLTAREKSLQNVLTDSGKLHYYLAGAEFASTEDTLRVAGVK
ncbi:aconitase X catalytic domain-containing protein [Photobacterium sp. BZF1]|uniref:aconitase X catalytic domain-containing protein n=1 Tax=Photobacterium sp. BZF1 TaxID=1904457 RepID=UPI001653A92D|nr:aconitase X catalytic domain-containing protein [Photobacterium sp. BZF1]